MDPEVVVPLVEVGAVERPATDDGALEDTAVLPEIEERPLI